MFVTYGIMKPKCNIKRDVVLIRSVLILLDLPPSLTPTSEYYNP